MLNHQPNPHHISQERFHNRVSDWARLELQRRPASIAIGIAQCELRQNPVSGPGLPICVHVPQLATSGLGFVENTPVYRFLVYRV